MENEIEEVIPQEDDQIVLEELDLDTTDDVDTLKKEIATLKAQKEHFRKKATEKDEKPVEKPTEKKDDLSTTDLYALMNAKVPQEDVEEVVKAAKLLGKSVQEALKDETVKTILERREGYRKTSEATNNGTRRPATKTVTVDEIVTNASKGIFPEKGSKEAEELFWARRGKK